MDKHLVADHDENTKTTPKLPGMDGWKLMDLTQAANLRDAYKASMVEDFAHNLELIKKLDSVLAGECQLWIRNYSVSVLELKYTTTNTPQPDGSGKKS